MLILSRRVGEKIQIGDDVTITVVDLARGLVRIGIDAPREVPIHRTELLPLKAEMERRRLDRGED